MKTFPVRLTTMDQPMRQKAEGSKNLGGKKMDLQN